MTRRNSLTEQEQANLVAYLDGELTGEDARAIEAKLSLEPEARAEAELLRRTWELLDYLPKPEPSPTFTSRTISKLAPIREGKSPTGLELIWLVFRLRGRWLLLGLGWALVLLLSALAGYHGYNWVVPRQPGEKEMVRDLPLIKNKPYYDLVGDVEFLNKLDQPDLFGEEGR